MTTETVLLALDPGDFPELRGARQVLERGRKHPANPVLSPRPGQWDGTRCKVYGTVLFHPAEKLFKMWYSGCTDVPDAVRRREGTTRNVGYAFSADGVHWERPNLGIVEFAGSRDNNLVLLNAQAPSVFLRPDAEPATRYMMFTEAGLDTARNRLLYSADGVRWTTETHEPVTSYLDNRIHEPFSLVYDADEPDAARRWKGYSLLHPTRNGYRGRSVGLFVGPDPEHWTEYEQQPILSPFDGLESEIHLPYVTRMHGRFVMLYDAMEPNHHTQTEIALSYDGYHFQRIQNGVKVLPNGKPGEPDAGCICVAPRACFTHEGRIWCYYTMSADTYQTAPRNFRCSPWYRYTGLAHWREDGFASLRAGDADERATVTSRTLAAGRAGVGTVWLNAVAPAADAGLTVEVVNPAGEVLAASRPWTGDHLRGAVAWQGARPDLTPGTPYALRVTFGGSARLYAVGVDGAAPEDRRSQRVSTAPTTRRSATGPRIRWTFRAEQKIGATPLLHGDTVYVTSWDQRVYALDAATGRERWRFETGNAITTTPAVHGERLFVASRDGHLYALNRKTGNVEWKMRTGAWFDSSPTVGAHANRWGDEAEAPQRLFVGCHDRAIHAVDPGTGQVCWRFPTWNWVLSRPAVADYTVYGASLDGVIYAIDGRCGGMLWSYRIGRHLRYASTVVPGSVRVEAVAGSPLVTGGVVYCGGDDGYVYALDARTGVERWHHRTDGPVQGTPLLAGSLLVVASVDGHAYGLRADSGERLWSTPVDNAAYADVIAAHDSAALVASTDCRLYVLDPATGRVRDTFEADAPLRAAPAVGPDGALYLPSVAGTLYAIR